MPFDTLHRWKGRQELCAFVVLFAAATNASAFCLAPPLVVSDEFYVSERVLVGTVVSSNNEIALDDAHSFVGTNYRVKVANVLRGPVVTTVQVYSENTSARFPLMRGRSYLLFLRRDPQKRWTVDNCGNSGALQNKRNGLREISGLSTRKSFVYGGVYPYSGTTVCQGMQLNVRSAVSSRTTHVRANCSFQIGVPAGKYSAILLWHGLPVPAYDLPYKNPYCFVVPVHGSAGLAFRPMTGADQMNVNAISQADMNLKKRCPG